MPWVDTPIYLKTQNGVIVGSQDGTIQPGRYSLASFITLPVGAHVTVTLKCWEGNIYTEPAVNAYGPSTTYREISNFPTFDITSTRTASIATNSSSNPSPSVDVRLQVWKPSGYVKVNGSWREITSRWVKVNGQWRQIVGQWVKVNGQWRQA